MSLFVKVASILISAISILANALICHIIVRLKTMKTSINYIILNLAILDAIFSFISIFYIVLQDHEGYMGQPILQQAYNYSPALAEILCKFKWTYYSTPSASPIFLMTMAYERYKAIADPFSRIDTGATKTRIKCMLTLAWLSGLAYLTIDMIIVYYEKETIFCDPKSYPWFNFEAYLLVFLITQYIIPSTAMLIFYGRLICALRKQDNALGPQAEAEKARRKARKKVLWVIVAVTLVFYICCGIPKVVQDMLNILDHYTETMTIVWDLLVLLLSLNSAFNPFLYFIFIQSFRDGFKRVFLSKFRNPNFISSERNDNSRSQQSISFEGTNIVHNRKSQAQLLSVRSLDQSGEN